MGIASRLVASRGDYATGGGTIFGRDWQQKNSEAAITFAGGKIDHHISCPHGSLQVDRVHLEITICLMSYQPSAEIACHVGIELQGYVV